MTTGQPLWHAYELLFPNGMSTLHSLKFTDSSKCLLQKKTSKCLYDIISIPKKSSLVRLISKLRSVGKKFHDEYSKVEIQFRVLNVKE